MQGRKHKAFQLVNHMLTLEAAAKKPGPLLHVTEPGFPLKETLEYIFARVDALEQIASTADVVIWTQYTKPDPRRKIRLNKKGALEELRSAVTNFQTKELIGYGEEILAVDQESIPPSGAV